MRVNVCDQCRKPLGDKFCHIPVYETEFGTSKGVGRMLTRIGGGHLCKECAMGIAEMVNGDQELGNVRRHDRDIDYDYINKLHNEGMRNIDIVKKTGYSRTSVSRAISTKKAAPK